MMWPFKSKVKSLNESGIFQGFTDWHSHILPGVDDGVKTMEEALALLTEYERLGFKRIWLTPHIMEDYPNEPEQLLKRFEELKSRWKGKTEIKLAAEHMLDNLFEQRIEEKNVLPIGDAGTHILVETSYYTPPYGMDEMLEKTRKAGFFPILAHPERYRYMEEKDYKKLKEDGVFFQLNLLSLTGGYGETAKKKAEWLLKNKMIDIAGSDVHKLNAVLAHIDRAPGSNGVLQELLNVVRSPALN